MGLVDHPQDRCIQRHHCPSTKPIGEVGTEVLHVRDATMRLNETALQCEKLQEEQQSLAQLNRIKEGVQLLLDALERNMERHQECTPTEALMLEHQLADTSKALRDVLDLERHPHQPSIDWIPKLNRIEKTLSKYAEINQQQSTDIELDAMVNLDRLFQSINPAEEA